jgi:hypothetical protein
VGQCIRLRLSIVGSAALLCFFAIACEQALASAETGGVHEGIAACSGSACHGRLVRRDHGVWLNEIPVWQDIASPAGAHSRAWQVLEQPRAEAIARRLGLSSAESAPMCLGCHLDPAEARGPKFQESDGVGCEACHGGAKSWLASHYVLGTRHADNVARGMVALEDPRQRAQVCLDCHFGSAAKNQFVTHEMMAAGHPRISFELDLFSDLQRHYSVDADYAKQKAIAGGAKTWAVGQAAALDRALALYSSARGGGVFPEFYFFDCHSCHRAVSSEPEARPRATMNPARPIPPGSVPFNDSNMIMLAAAVRVAAPQFAVRYEAETRAFHSALTQSREAAVAKAVELAATAREIGAVFEGRTFTAGETLEILNLLLSDNLSVRYTDYSGSEQAVMAIDTLRNALVVSNTISKADAEAMQPDIDRLYKATHDPNQYNPAEFRSLLQRVQFSIRRPQR